MNTVFSLVFFDCYKNEKNPLSVTKGPFLFDSEESAKKFLLDHVRSRVAASFADALAEEANTQGLILPGLPDKPEESITASEAYSIMLNGRDYFTFETLVNWYASTASDEDIYFDYKIESLPTSSFVELLQKADAIEINGNFTRDFNVDTYDNLHDDDILLEVSMVNDCKNKLEHDISIREAESATFNASKQHWEVAGLTIKTFQFA